MMVLDLWATQPRRLLIALNWHMPLLLLIALPLLLINLDTFPAVWFDEGYKLNAAHTLEAKHVYASYTINGLLPFDPGISSGPADVVPVALAFRLFGAGVAQARMVSVIFTILGVCALYQIAAFMFDRRVALFATLFMMAFPAIQGVNFLILGRQILGEPAALMLVALGLWFWFKSWSSQDGLYSVLGGVAIGLGLLSKTQVAIGLLPAIGLITLGRFVNIKRRWQEFITPVVMVGVVGGWMLIGQIVTPPAARAENSQMLMQAIQTNLLTDLYGQSLTMSALIIVAVMTVAGLGGFWRVLRHRSRTYKDAQWAEATLTLFVMFSAQWFALLSVGWPRYAYVGLCFSLLLFGKLVWDVLNRLLASTLFERVYPVVIGGLALAVVGLNTMPVLGGDHTNYAAQVVNYIDAQIPDEAIVETWEWELSGLGAHDRFHHPHQRYLFEAIRQFSHNIQPFELDYDPFQADPDFLIVGTFGTWTEIYKQLEVEAKDFTLIAEFGPYRVLERVR